MNSLSLSGYTSIKPYCSSKDPLKKTLGTTAIRQQVQPLKFSSKRSGWSPGVLWKTALLAGLVFSSIFPIVLASRSVKPSSQLLKAQAEVAAIKQILDEDGIGILAYKSLAVEGRPVLIVGEVYGNAQTQKTLIRDRCAEDRTCFFVQEGLLRLNKAEEQFRRTMDYSLDSPVFGLENPLQEVVTIAKSSLSLRNPSEVGHPSQDHHLAVTSFAKRLVVNPVLKNHWNTFKINADKKFVVKMEQIDRICSAISNTSFAKAYSQITPQFVNKDNSSQWADLLSSVARHIVEHSNMSAENARSITEALDFPNDEKKQEHFNQKWLLESRDDHAVAATKQLAKEQPLDRPGVVWVGAAHVDGIYKGLSKAAGKSGKSKQPSRDEL